MLAVGNSYAPDVITGRYDALVGLLLRGDGAGRFEAVPHPESGFFVDGDAKGLALLHDAAGRSLYVATQNNDTTRVFTRADGYAPQTLTPAPLDAYAEIVFPDGTTQRHELYYGAGYLSQSSRRLRVPPGAAQVTLYRYDGAVRIVPLPPK